MNKNRIRLTERQLHSVIKESVRRVLNETSLHPTTLMNYTQQLHEISNSLMGYSDLRDVQQLIGKSANMLDNYGFEKFGKYFSDMLDDELTKEKEPEDWYERNEHGDFDNY